MNEKVLEKQRSSKIKSDKKSKFATIDLTKGEKNYNYEYVEEPLQNC